MPAPTQPTQPGAGFSAHPPAGATEPEAGAPILSVRELQVRYRVSGPGWPWSPQRVLQAVRGVSFDLRAGETLGVVGESGCGKSSLARALLKLVPMQAQSLRWFGSELANARPAAWQTVRRQAQMVFQDPLASLDPRMNVLQIVGEPLRAHEPDLPAREMQQRIESMIERVGLDRSQLYRYPHEFSGGQCQRIGIARALILRPKVLICDEPVSALDVSIQAQIINLLGELQAELGLAMIFIAHDLSVIRHVSQRVLVMYLGRVVELAQTAQLFDHPRHPYSRALLASVPIPDPRIERGKAAPPLHGEIASPLAPPSGCVFRTRCPDAQARCAHESPALTAQAPHHEVACWFPLQSVQT
jgi:oligopeptide transport system ATP-binding protein